MDGDNEYHCTHHKPRLNCTIHIKWGFLATPHYCLFLFFRPWLRVVGNVENWDLWQKFTQWVGAHIAYYCVWLPRKWKISLVFGKRAKGRVLAPPEMQRSFYKSFTSGHECAGLVLCYVANDSLTLFASVSDISCKNLKKTCQEGHYFIIFVIMGRFYG